MGKSEDEFKIYDQICTSYHAIDDFRAKLLGLIPLVTGAGISNHTPRESQILQFLLTGGIGLT